MRELNKDEIDFCIATAVREYSFSELDGYIEFNGVDITSDILIHQDQEEVVLHIFAGNVDIHDDADYKPHCDSFLMHISSFGYKEKCTLIVEKEIPQEIEKFQWYQFDSTIKHGIMSKNLIDIFLVVWVPKK